MLRHHSVNLPKWAPMEDINRYYTAYRSRGDKTIHVLTRRPALTISAFIATLVLLFWYIHVTNVAIQPYDRRSDFNGNWNFLRDKDNLMLDEKQCQAAFPGLFQEIERAVEGRKLKHITREELDTIEPKNGYIRAMIFDQEVCFVRDIVPFLTSAAVCP